MDNLVYEESINTEVSNSEFVSKKWIYCNDNNSQNYSSQVILDTTALSNSGAYLMWAEAFIIMPLVVCLSASVDSTSQGNFTNAKGIKLDADSINQSWAFKSGFMNMVHSCTIEYNNSNICQQTPLVNVMKNFEILTSWSQDNLKNDAPSTGFYPDSSSTFGVSTSTNATTTVAYSGIKESSSANPELFNNCVGVLNNLSATVSTAVKGTGVAFPATVAGGNITVAATETLGTLASSTVVFGSNISTLQSSYINNGVYQRNMLLQNDTLSTGSFQNKLSQSLIYSPESMKTNYINERVDVPLGQNNIYDGGAEWFIYAKIYLKNLADIFEKSPLLKGSTLRFYINTNQCLTSFQVNTSDAPANAYIDGSKTGVINNGGSTNPLMITNLMAYAIASSHYLNNTTLTAIPANSLLNCYLSVSIYKNNWSQQNSIGWSTSQLQSCRLYAPAYKFTQLAEQKYLSLTPTKTIEYNDVFQYQFQNIGGNGDFNILVSNGLQGIQSVLVIPFYQPTSGAPIYNPAGNYSSLLSPFCSSGSSPDPIPLTNFNILVSGVNLFLDNQQWDFQQFIQELKSSNQLNGNLTEGLTSGLINEKDFSSLYRYYYGNCKRILPAEEDVSRSVQIRGKVNLPQTSSTQNIMLMVFVQFKRKITIDLLTGARID